MSHLPYHFATKSWIISLMAGVIGFSTIGCMNPATSSIQPPVQPTAQPTAQAVAQATAKPTVEAALETPDETSSETSSETPAPIVVDAIENGRYWIGHTDQGLEVDGKRYRYDTEAGTQPWKDSPALTYVRKGVVFDGQSYWCLASLFPKGKIASCSAEGWNVYQPKAEKPKPAEPSQSVLSPKDLGALLSKGMVYDDFRSIVMSNGWTPLVSSDCKKNVGGEARICDRLPEVNSCSGDGYCLMYFEDKTTQTRFSVTTYGPEPRVTKWGFGRTQTP